MKLFFQKTLTFPTESHISSALQLPLDGGREAAKSNENRFNE